jgi:hypothetical protein
MIDITPKKLTEIKSYRLPDLELEGNFIHPDYHGGSILNLPPSICQWLGIPQLGENPLRPELLVSNSSDVRRVILILVDALSLLRLQRWMSDGTASVWSRLAGQGQLAALTSIVPSTTSAALTSLWSGTSPAKHGIIGYEMWLKEYGVVSNMILHTPITFENDSGSLGKAGFKPEQFLNLPTLGTHLASYGVKSYALQHRSIIRSGLSQMFFRDVSLHGFLSSAELWVNLRHLIESNPQQRQFFWIYTGQIDHFSHFYHPDDERTAAEFSEFSQTFEQHFLDQLSPATRRGTLIVLTADHGMIATRQFAGYDLRNHPELSRCLHILPTGEHRLMYLFIKPGQVDEVRGYFDQTWPGQFALLDPTEAVAKGLFGPGTPHPRLAERMGDLIAIARDNAYLWWAEKENMLIGQHGGLSAEEMIVPLLSAML